MVRTVATGVALVVLGIVLTGLGVHQLGVVRAARKWPAARPPRVGRGVAGVEVAAGLVVAAAGGVLLTTLIPVPAMAGLAIAGGVGLAVIGLGMLVSAKLADHVELNALIRSPSPLYRAAAPGPGGRGQTATADAAPASAPVPRLDAHEPGESAAEARQSAHLVTVGHDASDPAVPIDAEPGWVLTDAADTWYLCVAGEHGRWLVVLPDFRLAAPDPRRELRLAGTVELSVWPLPDTRAAP